MEQPTGELTLTTCDGCSHVFNRSFDSTLLEYGLNYENSLHFSGTFSSFAQDVAERLVTQHDLRKKRIVDIGCGKGDFLALLCELGENHGFGFDQSYEEGRAKKPKRGSAQYFREHFTSARAGIQADLVTCRHVLEHIPDPVSFLKDLREAFRDCKDCAIYFEVPNALFTIRDLGIWDLIYEHCQYFTARSLAKCFADAGFGVEKIYECFGGQFLGLDGSMGASKQASSRYTASDFSTSESILCKFEGEFDLLVEKWRTRLNTLDGRVVVWGGGSKGVTFLNLLQLGEQVAGVVDINPHKQGKYVAVTGHKILSPENLRQIDPSHVLVMNPLYQEEISNMLVAIGVDAEVELVN